MRARKTVRQHTIPLEHAVALLRLEPEQQIALAEENRASRRPRRRIGSGGFSGELKWSMHPH